MHGQLHAPGEIPGTNRIGGLVYPIAGADVSENRIYQPVVEPRIFQAVA
jgi:hypothetical protein